MATTDPPSCRTASVRCDPTNPAAPVMAMRVIRVAHGGISHARNAGIAEATGEHFRFIDADDVLEPWSTARLVRLAGAEPGGALAYGATLNCDEELRPLEAMRSDLEGWIVE